VITAAENFGSGILHLNLCPTINEYKDYQCQFLSIFAGNIWEWYMIDIAAMLFGLTLSPLYDTLGMKTAGYILN
jgi:long-subunit acyl-CoA synthetase (AMP-forming)